MELELPNKAAFQKIEDTAIKYNSILCLGLDPDTNSLDKFRIQYDPEQKLATHVLAEKFCEKLINETKDLVCAYKPNSAFFEALGAEGFKVLERICIKIKNLDIPIILDVKRGDIGSTAAAYAQAAFDIFHATIVTVNPYLGLESCTPYLNNRSNTGLFLLCRTSNPDSDAIQTLICQHDGEKKPLYKAVVDSIVGTLKEQTHKSSIGLVIGANREDCLRKMRKSYPNIWILSPGIGAQGANYLECIQAGIRYDGLGLILPMSRTIANAENPRSEALYWREAFNKARSGCFK